MKNLKIFTDNIEHEAREQIDLLLAQELFKEEKEKERQERKRRIEDKQRKRELQKLKQEYEDR